MPHLHIVNTDNIDKQSRARAGGYQSQACGECGNFTLVISGSGLQCDTCGTRVGCTETKESAVLLPTIRVSHSLYLKQVKREWPDRHKVAAYLADVMDTLSQQCPPMARSTLFRFLAGFGATVALAKTPEECVDAFVQLMKHLACPEPGWEGASLILED